MSRLRISAFIFLALIGSSLGISGGIKAKSGEFPYQVSIQTPDEFGNYCGGSILNSRWILTAATCIISPNTTLFYIMAGTTDWKNPDNTGTKYEISEVVVHPDNANNRAIDLALIKVKGEIIFSNTIQSIQLPQRDIVQLYMPVNVTAWGSSNSENSIRDLRYFTAYVLGQNLCRLKYPWIKEWEMCIITTRGNGICFKDVGSPIASKNVQVAIATNRSTCGSGDPDQVIRIWNYVDWIKSVINR